MLNIKKYFLISLFLIHPIVFINGEFDPYNYSEICFENILWEAYPDQSVEKNAFQLDHRSHFSLVTAHGETGLLYFNFKLKGGISKLFNKLPKAKSLKPVDFIEIYLRTPKPLNTKRKYIHKLSNTNSDFDIKIKIEFQRANSAKAAYSIYRTGEQPSDDPIHTDSITMGLDDFEFFVPYSMLNIYPHNEIGLRFIENYFNAELYSKNDEGCVTLN